MEFREVLVEDKEWVDRIRQDYSCSILANSFSTLFLWKEVLGLSIFLEKDFFVVKSQYYGKNSYFFPCGNQEKVKYFIESHRMEMDFCLIYMSQKDVEFVNYNFEDNFILTPARESWEYIFCREEHLRLAGKRYAKIRYEEEHLKKHYELKSEPISEETVSDAIMVIDAWEKRQGNSYMNGFDDYWVAEKALRHWKELMVQGCLVYVNGKPGAIVMGTEVNPDTFGIQIAKLSTPITGLLYYSLHSCFRMISDQYKYINGDDDLGVSGIRLHKNKMRPCLMNEIWKGTVNP